ncbi:MAG: TetR family transcriptional regulator [Pseudoxanthomonas sp.]
MTPKTRSKPRENKRGQVIGDKGERSRDRLMDGALEVLRRKNIWEVGVIDICAACKVAPSNLYTYFNGVEDVVIALAEREMRQQPDLLGMLSKGPWEGRQAIATARKFVEVCFDFWNRNRPILKTVELLADEGDARFSDIRAKRLLPIYAGMRPLIVKAQRAGLLHKKLDPNIAAICAIGLIESAGMHIPLIVAFDNKLEDLVETQARLLLLHLTGRQTGTP